jgi:hypothetical protein
MSGQERMQEQAPTDFCVPGGTLIYDAVRDSRFPYIHQVKSHPLVHDPDILANGRIFVFIQDTSPQAMEKLKEFEDSLEVPLGPDENMEGQGEPNSRPSSNRIKSCLGMFELLPNDVLFSRDMHDPDPEKDVVQGWNCDG